MANSRFSTLANGVVVEAIATITHIEYDPTTQVASVVFGASQFMQVEAGAYTPVGNARDNMRVNLSPRMAEIVGASGDIDPVTQVDLSQVSLAGVMVLVKRFYDTMHNLRASGVDLNPRPQGGTTGS